VRASVPVRVVVVVLAAATLAHEAMVICSSLSWKESSKCAASANLAASGSEAKDRNRYVKMRDFVASRMTPEQIAEAQRLAREWKPK